MWIDLFDENRAIMFDLGDTGSLGTRKLLRVERVVVSHTHMDHFVGFDRLLRLVLGREKELTVTGPPGFLRSVQGKIEAYTWNLISDYPVKLRAEEIDGVTVRSVLYTGAGGMLPEPQPDREWNGTIHAERLFTLHGVLLDHEIPVVATAVRETEHISVNRDRLLRAGLAPGPWLRDLKQAVRRCEPMDHMIEASTREGGSRRYRIDELEAKILFRTPGRRIAYVTDTGYTPANVEKVVALARDVDLLVCECAFLDEDRDLARERFHLTARQAGEIARAANAGKLAPFHFSPRYRGRERELFQEASSSFGGPVVNLVETGSDLRLRVNPDEATR